MTKSKKNTKIIKITLNKKQVDFIDKMCKKICGPKERKLSRPGFLKDLLACVMEKIKIDVKGVKNKQELEQRFLKAFEECLRKGKTR